MKFPKAGVFNLFSYQRVLLSLAIVSLASCRLIITTDETGSILSASGSANCDQDSCVIPINSPQSETFTAVAADGYRFVRWGGICVRAQTEVCTLKLSPLPEVFSKYDADVGISAIFEVSSSRRAWYRDKDGDGFGAANQSVMAFERPEGFVISNTDCNDDARSVNPWSKEREDGRDNNCDGTIDAGMRTFYRDVDGDGFGRSFGATESVEPIDGYVENSDDCDDSNDGIFPGAQEKFDSVDNNCDGVIDEGFSERTYYRDVDGDGFGNASDSVQDVSRPQGFVTNKTDNCPSVYNPSQSDSDGDQRGDACDSVNNGGNSGGGSCTLTAEDQLMLDTVNATRAQSRVCGSEGSFPAVSPLSWSCELKAAAQGHSMDMANNNFFDHTGSNGLSVGTRATQAGYSWSSLGENIAAGASRGPVSVVVQAWIDSPGHCSNLMRSSYTQLGAAKFSNASSTYNIYWTQVFGRPR